MLSLFYLIHTIRIITNLTLHREKSTAVFSFNAFEYRLKKRMECFVVFYRKYEMGGDTLVFIYIVISLFPLIMPSTITNFLQIIPIPPLRVKKRIVMDMFKRGFEHFKEFSVLFLHTCKPLLC